MHARHRSLRRWERAFAYGVAGVASEVMFTGARDSVLRRDWRLRGHSYLWMVPIYGLSAFLFEPMHDSMRRRPLRQRAAAYSIGIMGVEYVGRDRVAAVGGGGSVGLQRTWAVVAARRGDAIGLRAAVGGSGLA